MVIASLVALAMVQAVWVWQLYADSVSDFKRRVESAAYKSIYKAFLMDAIPGLSEVKVININLDDFAFYFEPNLLELDALQPYSVEVLHHDAGKDRVMMQKGTDKLLKNRTTANVPIDEEGEYYLRLTIELPLGKFFQRLWGLIFSSIAIIVLLTAVLIYILRTLFRQKSLEEMRRDFTNNITHELKTPLSVAIAATDAMRNFSADANKRSRYLEIVEVQLTQLSTMIEQILAVSVEGREFRYNPETIDLHPFINSIAQSIKLRDDKAIKLHIECSQYIAITADAFHLKNMLTTIIDNAIKYANQPNIKIAVRTTEAHVIISITDNGCGIAREHLKHIFEKYYRVPQGDIQSSRGYGLGLYYAQQVAILHGGEITAESSLNQGTTISVKLPYHE